DHLRDEGWQVDYRQAPPFTAGITAHLEEARSDGLITMAAADYPGRTYQQSLSERLGLPVTVLRNTQFQVERHNPIPEPEPGKRYVMEYFYRDMRRHFNILVDEGGEPAGGAWNYDEQNRKSLPEAVELPGVSAFAPDAITRDVMEQVAALGHTTGSVEGFAYAVTHTGAQQALATFLDERFRQFGPYEDAMTTRGAFLFHSVLSPYLNVGLLTPLQVVDAALDAYQDGSAPLNSVEGFVRQIIGWREFIYWQYWRQMPDLPYKNDWGATRPMPQMFWDAQTDMNCIRHVAERARAHAYTHHIERLMVVTNFCTLAGIKPQAVLEWFMAFYIDAYDWVMQPNVIGMGLNADGGITATKPYISSANYINKMSDYCDGCRFARSKRHGENACPFNFLYWNFLLKHEDRLKSNPRFGPAVYGLRHLDEDERAAVREQAAAFLDGLATYEA
ncbi:MAG: cryptochrome/photolyase family protein, partial [Anaerolineae bacterium]